MAYRVKSKGIYGIPGFSLKPGSNLVPDEIWEKALKLKPVVSRVAAGILSAKKVDEKAPDAAQDKPVTDITGMTMGDAKALIEDCLDAKALAGFLADEQGRKDKNGNPSVRSTLIKAIEAQLEKLKPEAATT